MARSSSFQFHNTKEHTTRLDDQAQERDISSYALPFALCRYCNDELYTPIKINGDFYCSHKCGHIKEKRRGEK